MLLAIDAGNTNLVFALVEDGVIRARWRIATDPRRTADQYAVWLHQLLALEGFTKADVSAVIIGTVVPRALHNLEVLASKYFGSEPLVAGQGAAEWGIELDVAEPKSVGADRVLNVIAAHALYEGDLIVVDFGTATTFDVVDYSGAYKGGIIAPGINLSLDALVNAAAKLPRIAIEAPEGNSRHRPHHRGADAYRHLLGLCRDDGGAGRAPEGRDRPPGHGHRHRRPRHLVRHPHRHFRRDRGRSDDPGAGDALRAERKAPTSTVIPAKAGIQADVPRRPKAE